MTNQLAIYEQACREVGTLYKAKEMRNKAEAMRVYARQAGNYDMEVDATLCREVATRRLGQLINGKKANGELKAGRPKNLSHVDRFPDLGIGPKLAILAAATAEISSKLFDGYIEARNPKGISQERKRLRHRKRHRDIAAKAEAKGQAISGQFPLIYADPPWRFEVHSEETSNSIPSHHYPTMTFDEIEQLVVGDIAITDLTTKDAVLFMWCTSANLVSALTVLEAWGFTYKTHAMWDKEMVGNGYIFRNQHELLLYGSKGKPPAPMQPLPSSVFRYRRGRHSEKPLQVRDAISRMYPEFGERHKIELFARGRIEGWTTWGYEAQ